MKNALKAKPSNDRGHDPSLKFKYKTLWRSYLLGNNPFNRMLNNKVPKLNMTEVNTLYSTRSHGFNFSKCCL